MCIVFASMAVQSCDADEVFRLFTIGEDLHRHFLLLDIRDAKHFKRGHIYQSFCVRLSSNQRVLADYSQADRKFSQVRPRAAISLPAHLMF